MDASSMIGSLSTATSTSVPAPHSKLMGPPLTSVSKGKSQRNRDANINQGRKRKVTSQEDFPGEDPNFLWEEDSNVREWNSKRARNTSSSISDNEPIGKKQKIENKEHFQVDQQTQNTMQQITQHQEKTDPVTPQSSTKFATSFDDFEFSKNPSGAGIEFGSVCGKCGFVCVTGEGWSIHQNCHRGDGINCAFCPQVFLTQHARDAHQQLHRGGHCLKVDDYCVCNLCGGEFLALMYLELHILECHGKDSLHNPESLHLGNILAQGPSCPTEEASTTKLFRCGVCSLDFNYSLNLECHMAIHTEVSYACSLCDADYSSLDTLVTHSQTHLDSTNNPVYLQSRRLPAQPYMS